MKFASYFSLIFVCGILNLPAQQTTTSPNSPGTDQADVPAPTAYHVVDQGANQKVWQREVYEKMSDGTVVTHLRKYTEVASGLSYQKNGQWADSREEIDIQADGTAAATQGQHQVYFPADIYEGKIRSVTPDGLSLSSQPVALAYDDGDNTVVIAVLTNSVGQLLNTNQAIYPDAFYGIKADVLYNYKRGGFEQDIVLHQQPPSPESLGLNPATTKLQVLTEFFNPPTPVEQSSTADAQTGLPDTTLKFGSATFGHGHAFLIDDVSPAAPVKPSARIPVYKTWLNLQGRTFLIESVPYRRVSAQLQRLPLSASVASPKNFRQVRTATSLAPASTSQAAANSGRISAHYQLPPARLVTSQACKARFSRMSSLHPTGLVLDYVTINSGETDFTFKGDLTYYVSGDYGLSGTTTIEGGAVIKLDGNGELFTDSSATPFNCKTSPYRPAIFTSYNDDSVGEAISGSSGSPSYTDVNYYLDLNGSGCVLKNVRFAYTLNAIYSENPENVDVWDSQFVNMDIVITFVGDGSLSLHNVLMGNVQLGADQPIEFNGAGSLLAEQCTFDGEGGLIYSDAVSYDITACFTNCVMGLAGETTTVSTQNVAVIYGGSYKTNFQSVGAGNYYLATNSLYRNVGTTNISPALLAEIRQKTTYPPVIYSDIVLATNLSLPPQAQRDTNTPDLGYHYDPLDYAFTGVEISNNVALNLTTGTAATWYQGDSAVGLRLDGGSNFSITGTADNLCRFTEYSYVQEGADTPGGSLGLLFNGGSSVNQPQVNARFTQWFGMGFVGNLIDDRNHYGIGNFWNCEFYANTITSYSASSFFTNCFFFRYFAAYYGSSPHFNYQNCTFYDGAFASAASGTIENTAFDGTDLAFFGATTNNYNAYNTNNLDWQSYAYYSPTRGTVGTGFSSHDVPVGDFNWQTNRFGNYYQPVNSTLIDQGGVSAASQGLYHFTTQTSQVKEANSMVDIGYHYVAVDSNGVPISTPGDGTPDYQADANGNGVVDSGETPWTLGIVTQPQSTNVAQGQNAIFSVLAGGIGPISYQWTSNGISVSGANFANYTNFVVQTNASYAVIVNNTTASVTSSIAVLNVTYPLSLASSPGDQSVIAGTNVSFSVGVNGNFLVYQWFANGVAMANGLHISGATGSTVTISNVMASDAGGYYALVTNLFGSVTSGTAMLTVITNPAITVMPTNKIAIQSDDVTFDAGAVGFGLSYQWWLTNGLVTNAIPGATSASYTKLVVQTNDAGEYALIVTNIAGSTNVSASLTVLVPPWISQQPVNVLTNQGSNASFAITATGTPNLSYQWFKNGTNAISWATNASMTLTNVQATDAAGYTVLVTNVAGTNFSAWAWLSIQLTGGTTTNGFGGGSAPSASATVSMISPTNATAANPAIFMYGPPISIRASATSTYSYITNVTFYYTNVGTSFMVAGTAIPGANSKFALAWTNALPGTNIVHAVAWDVNGSSNTSPNVYVIMAVKPAIYPGPGTNVVWTEGASGMNISFSGAITNDGQPDFYAPDIQWSVSPSASISGPNTLTPQVNFPTNGQYSLQLQVDNGYATNVQPCTVNIRRRPQVSFSTFTNNQLFILGAPVVLKVTTLPYFPDTAIASVTFYSNNVVLGSGIRSVNNTFTYLWSNPPLWTNLVTAVATDDFGLSSTTSVSVVIAPPLAVQFLSPISGQLYVDSPTNVMLAAQAISYIGSPITSLNFTLGSTNLGAGTLTTNSDYQLLWQLVTNGGYTITVHAADGAGDTATNVVTITVNAMPLIHIVYPTNIQSFVATTNIPITAVTFDPDGTITNVSFYSVTNLPFAVTQQNPTNFTLVWSNRTAGYYPVVAVATDNHGAQSASQICVFKVTPTNGMPGITLTSPTNGNGFIDGSDITIAADATAGSVPITNVEFFVNGQSIGSDTEAPYDIKECCWKPGTYSLLAIASDSLGSQVMSTNVIITISNEPPISSSGFWDPTFGPIMLQYCTNVLGPPAVGPGFDLTPGLVSIGQTIAIANTFGVFEVTEGTNWAESPFPDALGGKPNLDYNDIPYLTLLADGTNIYAFGPTNQPGGSEADLSGVGYRLLKQMGNSFTWFGNDLYSGFLNTQRLLGILDVGGDLYVCGDFTSAGASDTNVKYIAKLDRTNNVWISVGNGLNAPVYTMAAIGNSLYIGGAFTNAGGNTNISYIARLAGNVWTNLGSGVSIRPPYTNETIRNDIPIVPVKTLAVCGSNLYVGGQFTIAGGDTNAHGVAVWDGIHWGTMNGGPGINTVHLINEESPAYDWPPVNVETISARGNRVFVGGDFSYVLNGQTQNTVTVDLVDVDPYPYEQSIVVSNDDGNVVPSGGIAAATWEESDHKWHWDGLGGGIFQGEVSGSLIVPGTSSDSYDLYIAGYFLTVGQDIASEGLARWRVGYPLPPGLPSVVITNPVNASIYTNISGAITITALVSSYTSIDEVNFYANGQIVDSGGPSGGGSYSLSWTPSYGLSLLTASAVDHTGAQGNSAPVLINVINTNSTVIASNDMYVVSMNNGPTPLNVLANDHSTVAGKLRVVNAFMVQGSAGTVAVSHDNSAIVYTPRTDAYGTDVLAYSVADGTSTNSAYVTVQVRATPYVEITQPSTPAEIRTNPPGIWSSTISGSAFGYGASITNVDLYVNGAKLSSTSSSTFSFPWTTNVSGVYTFDAVAFDANGNTNVSSGVTLITFNSTNNAVAQINNLPQTSDGLDGVVPTVVRQGLFDLAGVAEANGSTNGVLYQVLVHPPDDPYTVIANVTPNADAGGFHENGSLSDLGVLDLSSVPNGVYDLELVVYGGGTTASAINRFALDSSLKIGQFSFSEQDVSIPVNGIPLTVTRTYNSLNPLSSDFGYGWTFAVNSMDVELYEQRMDLQLNSDNAPFADDETLPQTVSVRTGGSWDVTLTLPDGRRATFPFDPNGSTPTLFAQWDTPPDLGNTTLQMIGNSQINMVVGGLGVPTWADSDLSIGNAPFENHDVQGWILTTPDGTKYKITRGNGNDVIYEDPDNAASYLSAQVYGPPQLTEIDQRNGNVIKIATNSVAFYTNNASNPTRALNFARDGSGRITAVYDPNGGTNGLPVAQYVYNQDNGNLIFVLKLMDRTAGTYATNSYRYDNPDFPHYITSIQNANGVPVAENFYDDSGKLTAIQDANGNLTKFIHSTTNNTDIIIDRLAHINTYVYDLQGNVIIQTNQLGQVMTMAYDSNNNKTNEVTYLGNVPYATNNYTYNGNHQVLVSTDPLGHTNSSTYDNFGNILTSTDANGNSTANTYDSGGNLIQTVDALGHGTTNFYNGDLLGGSINAIGTVTTNYYDGTENLISTATLDASGNILSSNSFTYDGDANRLTSTVWRRAGGSWISATTTNVYDAMNRVVQTLNPDGGSSAIFYDPTGKQQSTVDPLGHTTSYVYDGLGRLVQTVYADSTTESSAYDSNGNRTNSIDRGGNSNTYVYDALNRLVETIYADGATNSTFYDGVGHTAQTIDALGHVTAYGYDLAGRRLVVTNALFQVTSNTYDATGNQITFTDANGHSTTNVYDALNRQIQVQYADGTTNETVYDADGRKVATTNQDGIVTLFGYDGSGRLTSVTNAVNKAEQMVTRYQYDEDGNQTLQIDGLGRTNSFGYDSQGRRIWHKMPTNSLIEKFSYDLAGNEVLATNFNGAIITNQYDANNRLTNVSSAGYNVAYAYTATGQRQTMIDPSGTNTYSYDNRDRLLTRTEQWNQGAVMTLHYTYNAIGGVSNLWSSTTGGVNNVYQYDSLNRLTNVLAGGNSVAGYNYDLAGNLQALHYDNSVTNLCQYDSLNRLTNLVWKTSGTPIASFAYQLGLTGVRVGLTETNNGASHVYTWNYDKLYRLTNETISVLGTAGYGYDMVGNRTSRASTISGLTAASYSYNTNDWLNGDTYDLNGNTLAHAGTNYQYDVMNRLTNMNSGSVVVGYDGDGNRVLKIVGTITNYYLVDGMNPSGYAQVLEEHQGATLSRAYNYGMDLISQIQPGTMTNYYGFDGHGSVRFLTGVNGAITDTYVYDAYGTIIASTRTTANNYLYSGQQFDVDLGLYYNRARYLNTDLGRFWSSDSYEGNAEDPQSLHKYLYCQADSINHDDPSGHDIGDILMIADMFSGLDSFVSIVNAAKEAILPRKTLTVNMVSMYIPSGDSLTLAGARSYIANANEIYSQAGIKLELGGWYSWNDRITYDMCSGGYSLLMKTTSSGDSLALSENTANDEPNWASIAQGHSLTGTTGYFTDEFEDDETHTPIKFTRGIAARPGMSKNYWPTFFIAMSHATPSSPVFSHEIGHNLGLDDEPFDGPPYGQNANLMQGGEGVMLNSEQILKMRTSPLLH